MVELEVCDLIGDLTGYALVLGENGGEQSRNWEGKKRARDGKFRVWVDNWSRLQIAGGWGKGKFQKRK